MDENSQDFAPNARQQDALIWFEIRSLADDAAIGSLAAEDAGISVTLADSGAEIILSDTVENGEQVVTRFLVADGKLYVPGEVADIELPAGDMENAQRSVILSRLVALTLNRKDAAQRVTFD